MKYLSSLTTLHEICQVSLPALRIPRISRFHFPSWLLGTGYSDQHIAMGCHCGSESGSTQLLINPIQREFARASNAVGLQIIDVKWLHHCMSQTITWDEYQIPIFHDVVVRVMYLPLCSQYSLVTQEQVSSGFCKIIGDSLSLNLCFTKRANQEFPCLIFS